MIDVRDIADSAALSRAVKYVAIPPESVADAIRIAREVLAPALSRK